jgi:hypothetical protein
MRTSALIRWGGLAALVASIISIAIEIALLAVLGNQTYSVAALTTEWSVLYSLRIIATVLLMLGLVALFARQNQKLGTFGVAAFVIAATGTILVSGFAWALTFIFPALAEAVPEFIDALAVAPSLGVVLTLFLVTVGWLLFGIASLRAKVLPTIATWVVIVGSFLALVLNMMKAPMSWLIFDVGVLWMGWWLWSEREEEKNYQQVKKVLI